MDNIIKNIIICSRNYLYKNTFFSAIEIKSHEVRKLAKNRYVVSFLFIVLQKLWISLFAKSVSFEWL